MKYIVVLVFPICMHMSFIIAQSSDIECSVYRSAGAYLTLTPAHFDTQSLPKVGQQVMLSIYVKDNLPPGKNEGYYDLYLIEVIKLVPETKSITFKATASFDDRKAELGLPKLSFTTESKVKISWGK
jgi:hypothetical protein